MATAAPFLSMTRKNRVLRDVAERAAEVPGPGAYKDALSATQRRTASARFSSSPRWAEKSTTVGEVGPMLPVPPKTKGFKFSSSPRWQSSNDDAPLDDRQEDPVTVAVVQNRFRFPYDWSRQIENLTFPRKVKKKDLAETSPRWLLTFPSDIAARTKISNKKSAAFCPGRAYAVSGQMLLRESKNEKIGRMHAHAPCVASVSVEAWEKNSLCPFENNGAKDDDQRWGQMENVEIHKNAEEALAVPPSQRSRVHNSMISMWLGSCTKLGQNLPVRVREKLASSARLRVHNANDVIAAEVHSHAPVLPSHIYIVFAGTLELSSKANRDRRVLTAGHHVCELPLISQSLKSESVTVRGGGKDTKVIYIARDAYINHAQRWRQRFLDFHLSVLTRCPLFDGIPSSRLARLALKLGDSRQRFSRHGAVVLQQGQISRALYIVARGECVGGRKIGSTGCITVGRYRCGAFFGEDALQAVVHEFHGEKKSWARVVTDSRAVELLPLSMDNLWHLQPNDRASVCRKVAVKVTGRPTDARLRKRIYMRKTLQQHKAQILS
eukprot:g4485.t1